jgi:hypothetical protein
MAPLTQSPGAFVISRLMPEPVWSDHRRLVMLLDG